MPVSHRLTAALSALLALSLLAAIARAQEGGEPVPCAPQTTLEVTGAAPPHTALLLRFGSRTVGGGVSGADGRYQLALRMGAERPGVYLVAVVAREDGATLQEFPCAVPGAAPTEGSGAPPPGGSPTTRPPTATPPPDVPAPRPTDPPITRPASDFDRNGDGKVSCADFSTQAEARTALDAGYVNLDEDRDGIPCEGLPAEATP